MAWGTIDDAQFQQFAKSVSGKIQSQVLKQEIENSSRRIGTQALRGAKSRTPVDTGNLRRQWSIKGPSYAGSAFVIEVLNNADYASFVESGHRTRGGSSWISGQFMLYKTLQEIDAQMPQLLTPALKNMLGGLFD
ncbi:HK97 gp10 family phage protein [Agrilactobacillus composti]|uniref:HK97 gp10 family phage protein n=1 Tax=Agrilactobacillus composti TaxID=398555 RepID=UPI000558FB26|nr:HK97 gp10 family phage protein [Agrilactobacillus composti]